MIRTSYISRETETITSTHNTERKNKKVKKRQKNDTE